eukprot:jgi/Bigna1/83969/fgenesh1_pg.119_\
MAVDPSRLFHRQRRRDKAGLRKRALLPRLSYEKVQNKKEGKRETVAVKKSAEPDLEDFWNDLSDEEERLEMGIVEEIEETKAKEAPKTQGIGKIESEDPATQELDFDDSIGNDDFGDDDFDNGDDNEEENDVDMKHGRQDTKHIESTSESEKAKRKKRAHRRGTIKIIEKAHKSGLVDQWEDLEDGERRRSKRRRIKPTEWWNGQVRELERRKSGVGPMLPTLKTPTAKRSRHFVDINKWEEEKKAQRKKTRKTTKKRKKKDDDEEDEDDEDAADFQTKAWVQNARNGMEEHLSVAKLKSMITMEPLFQDGEKLPLAKCPLAGKWFETDQFSSGQLILPPGSFKAREVSISTEIFFVVGCEPKQMQVTIEEEVFNMSKGSHFFVPADNEYELHNNSKDTPARLLFCLVRDNAEAKSEDAGGKQSKAAKKGTR